MIPSADNPRTRAPRTLLGSMGGDDREAAADLLPEVCDELRRVAQVRMTEPPGGCRPARPRSPQAPSDGALKRPIVLTTTDLLNRERESSNRMDRARSPNLEGLDRHP